MMHKVDRTILGLATAGLFSLLLAATAAWAQTAPAAPDQAAAPAAVPAAAPAAAPAPRPMCQECGIVESVRDIEKKGEATGLGAAGGAVLGGLLGHQVGQGRGNTAATVVGAAGGAFAGHQVEKNMASGRVYQVAVRFEDGRQSTFSFNELPRWRQGDKVKLVSGMLQQN